jgi:hypothetical protein
MKSNVFFSINQLFVQWSGGSLPAVGYAAEFVAATVPPPAGLWLLGSGCVGLCGFVSRHQKRKTASSFFRSVKLFTAGRWAAADTCAQETLLSYPSQGA